MNYIISFTQSWISQLCPRVIRTFLQIDRRDFFCIWKSSSNTIFWVGTSVILEIKKNLQFLFGRLRVLVSPFWNSDWFGGPKIPWSHWSPFKIPTKSAVRRSLLSPFKILTDSAVRGSLEKFRPNRRSMGPCFLLQKFGPIWPSLFSLFKI